MDQTAEREMTPTELLGRAIAEAEAWVDDLMGRLDWHDRSKVEAALVATLHALRDALPQDEVIYLGAQLPPLLRGLYYEGWHPGARGAAKNRAGFLEHIHDAVHRDPGIDAEQVARAVLALLAARLSPAEREHAIAVTPKPLRPLWPD